MSRLPNSKSFLVTLISFLVLPLTAAASSEERLLSLVPPGAQVVDGISATPYRDQPGALLLLTRGNKLDYQDFFALTGVDSSRTVEQVVLVAGPDLIGGLNEHSLLARGHFDRPRIYSSATGGGAHATQYRGIPILLVEPFARERGDLDDVRWLAILDSDLFLLGTIASVHLELDRYLAGSGPDASIVQRLNRLHRHDEVWCLLAAPIISDEIRKVLTELDPEIARLIERGGAFQFGIHYNGHVEFEYEIVTSTFDPQPLSRSLMASLAESNAEPSMILPRDAVNAPTATDSDHIVHGLVKLSRQRYEAWLSRIYSGALTLELPK